MKRYDPLLIILLAFVVVFCITLHAVAFDHHHPGESGSELTAYLHGQDKKLFILAAIAQVSVFVLMLSVSGVRNRLKLDSRSLRLSLFSPLIL